MKRMKQFKSIVFVCVVIMMGLFIIGCALNEKAPISAGVNQNSTITRAEGDCPVPSVWIGYVDYSRAIVGVKAQVSIPNDIVPKGFYNLIWQLFKDGIYSRAFATTSIYDDGDYTTFYLNTTINTTENPKLVAGKYSVNYFVYNGSGDYMPPCYSKSPMSKSIVVYRDVTYSILPVSSSSIPSPVWGNAFYDGASTQPLNSISEISVNLNRDNPALTNVTISYSVKKSNTYGIWYTNGTAADNNNQTSIQGINIILANKPSNMKIKFRVIDSNGDPSDWIINDNPKTATAAEAKNGIVNSIQVILVC
jgi:hypothetical protein